MEFDININVLFRDVITKVDSRLQVCRNASARYEKEIHGLGCVMSPVFWGILHA